MKQSHGHDEEAEMTDIIGMVRNKTALIVDDFVISGGTLIENSRTLKTKGAGKVLAAVPHGVFSQGAMTRLTASDIETLYRAC